VARWRERPPAETVPAWVRLTWLTDGCAEADAWMDAFSERDQDAWYEAFVEMISEPVYTPLPD
jgi:hypothetical protein